MSAFRYVSASFPCPLCSKKADCRVNHDGMVFCHTHRHNYGQHDNHVYCGESCNIWGMWLPEHLANDPDRQRGDYSRSGNSRPSAPIRPTISAENVRASMYERLRRESLPCNPMHAEMLSSHLGLPASCADHMGFWEDHQSNVTPTPWGWTLPEYGFDDKGEFRPVCWMIRYGDGTKRNHGDIRIENSPKRGLTLLDDYDQGGIVYVPEGATCCLALNAMGLTAIGRPSSRQGAETLARHIALTPAFDDRPIIIIAENDLKQAPGELPRWEGRDGARIVAQQLADRLGRVVRVGYVPGGVKDVRDWFWQHWHEEGDEVAGMAERFEDGICRLIEIYEPNARPVQPVAPPVALPVAPPPPSQAKAAPDATPDFVGPILSVVGVSLIAQAMAKAQEAKEQAKKDAAKEASPASSGSLPITQEHEVARRVRVSSRERHYCPCKRSIILRNLQTHKPHVQEMRCESWRCLGCRGWLIERELLNAEFRFGQADQIWHLTIATEEWASFLRRLNRARANYWRVWVEDRDPGHPAAGYWLVFTDRQVGTDLGATITHADALDLLCVHLNDWDGDGRPCSTSHGWCRVREEKERQYERIGLVPRGTTRDEYEQIAADVNATVRTVRPLMGDGRTSRIYQFDREGGWDIDLSDRLCRNLMAGEVVPELSADAFVGAFGPATDRSTPFDHLPPDVAPVYDPDDIFAGAG